MKTVKYKYCVNPSGLTNFLNKLVLEGGNLKEDIIGITQSDRNAWYVFYMSEDES